MTAPEPGLVLAHRVWRRRPVVLGFLTAVVTVLVLGAVGVRPALPAYLVLGVAGVTLGAVDVATLRLPDVLVGPLAAAVAVLLGVAALLEGEGPALVRGLLAALVCFLLYLVLALVNPSGLGLGDVKLAAPLGLALGYLGWDAVLAGLLAGFGLNALVGLVLLLLRLVTRSSALPFGPFMLVGALIGVLLDRTGALGPF